MTHVEHLFMNICFFFFCFCFHELIDHLYFFFGKVPVQMLGISISWMPFSISLTLFLVCWVFLSRKDDVGLFFFPFLKSMTMRYFAFFFKNFIYLFLTVLGLHCCWDFSLVAASWGYSLVVCGLIIAVASLVVVHGLICSTGSNQCLLHWQVDCLPLSHLRSPFWVLFFSFLFFFQSFFLPIHMACGILVPQLLIKPVPPALAKQSFFFPHFGRAFMAALGLFLVAASRGCSSLPRLHIAVAFLVVKHRL